MLNLEWILSYESKVCRQKFELSCNCDFGKCVIYDDIVAYYNISQSGTVSL